MKKFRIIYKPKGEKKKTSTPLSLKDLLLLGTDWTTHYVQFKSGEFIKIEAMFPEDITIVEE